MIAVSVEPATAETPSEPQDEQIETFTAQSLLDLAREHASELDPRHRALYRDLPAERFHHAADLLSQLILAHQTYVDWHSRREHSAVVRRLIESSNQAELTCALAWCHLAFRVLPGPIPPRKRRDGDEHPRSRGTGVEAGGS